MTTAPFLSVIIPVYNAARTVERTLASLAHIPIAERHHVQVVVVNDGSTDDSPRLIQEAGATLPEFIWKRIDQPNGGLAAARNAALNVAQGEWIFFLDADDELACDLLPVLARRHGCTSVGFSVEFRRHGRYYKRLRPVRLARRNYLDVLTAGNVYHPSSLAFRRTAIDAPFDESLIALEDWLFWISNQRIFDAMITEPDIIAGVIHIHNQNMSSQFDRMGRSRARASDLVETLKSGRLSKGQLNNLFIQREIGKLQRRMRPSNLTYFRFPCDFGLYMKLLAYTAAAIVNVKPSPYQSLTPSKDDGDSFHAGRENRRGGSS